VADIYSTSTFHPSQIGIASTSGQCVTSVQFLCILQVYLGKEGESPEQQQGARVVSNLTTLVYVSSRNITTDNYFTSHALAKFLLGQYLTLLGTVRKMRKELPSEFVLKKHTSLESVFAFAFIDDITSRTPQRQTRLS